MSTSKEKKEPVKKWSKIVNKNKEGLIIVPPHNVDEDVDTITLSWEVFNENFDLDKENPNHCFMKEGSQFIEVFNSMKKTPRKVNPKTQEPIHNEIKEKKTGDDDRSNHKRETKKAIQKVIVDRKEAKAKNKPTKTVKYEYTMSIGDMIGSKVSK